MASDVLLRTRLYQESDFPAVWRLWQETLQDTWPTSQEMFREILHQPDRDNSLHRVIGVGNEIRGFLAAYADPTEQKATIQLVMVARPWQRQRLGSILRTTFYSNLRHLEIRAISFGTGAPKYFWHGIPDNLPGAHAFFRADGWNLYETSYDLTRDLTKFRCPAIVQERAEAAGITVRFAMPDDIDRILAFEKAAFPEWHGYFVTETGRHGVANLILAEQRGEVIGTVVISDFPNFAGAQWYPVFGREFGAFGCLGVRLDRRRQGAGMALAAFASEALRERGIRYCFVHWTWLPEWYGKLGYTIWRTYQMARTRTWLP